MERDVSHLQLYDLRGNLPVKDFDGNPDVHRLPSVIDTSCVMGFICPYGPGKPVHPPLVFRGNLHLRRKSQLPLVHALIEKMRGPTDPLVLYHRGRRRLSIVGSFVLLFPVL